MVDQSASGAAVAPAINDFVWKIEPLASLDDDAIVAAIAPTIQRYLDGDVYAATAKHRRPSRDSDPGCLGLGANLARSSLGLAPVLDRLIHSQDVFAQSDPDLFIIDSMVSVRGDDPHALDPPAGNLSRRLDGNVTQSAARRHVFCAVPPARRTCGDSSRAG